MCMHNIILGKSTCKDMDLNTSGSRPFEFPLINDKLLSTQANLHLAYAPGYRLQLKLGLCNDSAVG